MVLLVFLVIIIITKIIIEIMGLMKFLYRNTIAQNSSISLVSFSVCIEGWFSFYKNNNNNMMHLK